MEWFEKWINNRAVRVGKGSRRREEGAGQDDDCRPVDPGCSPAHPPRIGPEWRGHSVNVNTRLMFAIMRRDGS